MQKYDKVSLKDEILRVSEEGFRENGYDNTTFQKIADELGITKGAITYHFKNKHMLVAYFIQEMFSSFREFIMQYSGEVPNAFCKNCIVYIYVYRLVMKNTRNQELFYHKDQMHQWQTGKVQTIYGIYSDIAQQFGKSTTHEEIMMKVIMDLGARKRMYEEYMDNPFMLTLDKYCYYHVYLIGALSRLSDEEIKDGIETAFKFANEHEPPKQRLFG